MHRFKHIALITLGLHLMLAATAEAQPFLARCAQFIFGVAPQSFQYAYLNGFVTIRGIPVTGPEEYPAHTALERLDISVESLPSCRNKRVLTVGEGLGTLLDTFDGNGAHAEAVDLWYHQPNYPRGYYGKQMRAFVNKWGNKLIQGNAMQLPKADDSVDLYVSHALVNNLKETEIYHVVAEAVRVIDIGGEARLQGFDTAKKESVERFLKSTYGNQLEFEFKKILSEWMSHYGRRSSGDYVLIIRKIRN